jgi:hypothetical protein
MADLIPSQDGSCGREGGKISIKLILVEWMGSGHVTSLHRQEGTKGSPTDREGSPQFGKSDRFIESAWIFCLDFVAGSRRSVSTIGRLVSLGWVEGNVNNRNTVLVTDSKTTSRPSFLPLNELVEPNVEENHPSVKFRRVTGGTSLYVVFSGFVYIFNINTMYI